MLWLNQGASEPLVLSASLPLLAAAGCQRMGIMGCGCLSGIRDLTGMALAEAGIAKPLSFVQSYGPRWVVARGSDTKMLQRELLITSRLSSIDGTTKTKQGI
jgi:hypothetical protein